MPDTKLQNAMAEIKAILHKNDITGCIMLVSPTHAEHLYEFGASWSICSFDQVTGELRLKAKRADYPSQEAQTEAITFSAHMLQCFAGMARDVQHNMRQILALLERSVEVEGGPRREGPNPAN